MYASSFYGNSFYASSYYSKTGGGTPTIPVTFVKLFGVVMHSPQMTISFQAPGSILSTFQSADGE